MNRCPRCRSIFKESDILFELDGKFYCETCIAMINKRKGLPLIVILLGFNIMICALALYLFIGQL